MDVGTLKARATKLSDMIVRREKEVEFHEQLKTDASKAEESMRALLLEIANFEQRRADITQRIESINAEKKKQADERDEEKTKLRAAFDEDAKNIEAQLVDATAEKKRNLEAILLGIRRKLDERLKEADDRAHKMSDLLQRLSDDQQRANEAIAAKEKEVRAAVAAAEAKVEVYDVFFFLFWASQSLFPDDFLFMRRSANSEIRSTSAGRSFATSGG